MKFRKSLIIFSYFSYCSYFSIFLFGTLLISPAMATPMASKCSSLFSGQETRSATSSKKSKALLELINKIDTKTNEYTSPPGPMVLNIEAPTKGEFLKALYRKQLIARDDIQMALSDKLVAAQVIEHYLGSESQKFQTKTLGLRHFLYRNGLLGSEGEIIGSRTEIEAAIAKEFPNGVIIKPTSGTLSYETGGLIANLNTIVDTLSSGGGKIYPETDRKRKFVSPRLGQATSGERFVIQEKIGDSLVFSEQSNKKALIEYRIHLFDGKVVPETTISRFSDKVDTSETAKRAEAFIQDLMNRLPVGLKDRAGWAVDVLLRDDGQFRLVEINTNLGKPKQWSGWMWDRKVLGAYTRFLRDNYGWTFSGVSGWRLEHNMASFVDVLVGNIGDRFPKIADPLRNFVRILRGKSSFDYLQESRPAIDAYVEGKISAEEFVQSLRQHLSKFDVAKLMNSTVDMNRNRGSVVILSRELVNNYVIKLQLFYLDPNTSHPPHGHHNLAAIQYVLEGNAHLREYNVLDGRESNELRLQLVTNKTISPNDTFTTTESERNIHWFGALDKPVVVLNLNVQKLNSEGKKPHSEGRFYLDSMQQPNEDGMVKAVIIEDEIAHKKYDSSRLDSFF